MVSFEFLSLLALGSSVLALDAFQTHCTNFASIDLPNVKVNFATYVANGTNLSLPDNPPSCAFPSQQVTADMCRIAMAVATSNSSEITLEAWFPRNYTGRFLSTGNSGISGCIPYNDLAYTAQYGFASVGANSGHNGTSGKPFYQHPEVIEDFSYRSVHAGVVVGKELTKQFYERGFDKSYYFGCSTGGRQGFKSVQAFPNDFDGVLAGAPAFNFVNLASWVAHFYPTTGPILSDTYLLPGLWEVVHREILRQCDGLDGAEDGIIEDPDLCNPILDTIICKTNTNNGKCITGTQANTVRQALSPFYGANGTLLFPRMQPGSEVLSTSTVYLGVPISLAGDWWRYVVYNDPNYDVSKWNLSDATAALDQNPYNIQTWDADISAFRKSGGKVLTYHGLQDQLISSENSKLYYRRVAETMNLDPSEIDEFYRFFQISGMGHCEDGDGANGIGNSAKAYNGDTPESNVLMAIVKWVEEGAAPETVRGAKFANGAGSQVEYTRKHCRYPSRNVYKGPGNYTDENAWQCV